MRIDVSDAARTDTRNIASYTLEMWGAAGKAKYLAILGDRFSALLKNPDLGRPRDELSAGYRSLSAGPCDLLFRLR
jgi:plasmid stabilization system protein ParE